MRRRPERSGGGRLARAAPPLHAGRRQRPVLRTPTSRPGLPPSTRTRHRRQRPLLPRDGARRCSPRSCSSWATRGSRRSRATAGGASSSRSRSGTTSTRRARSTARSAGRCSHETQIYRIDHYLGKETVQNILVFRFANGIFEPIWNRRYIDHVQITAAETVGVEGRGGYYDKAGALRDMVPNHLFQLITLTAMEPPISFEADAVRDEQAKMLHAIQPFAPRGRAAAHGARPVRRGHRERQQAARATASEDKVPPDSNTETFVALKLYIDNWRWADVPFYLRTGKRLPKRETEIAIQFKRAPFVLFRDTPVEHARAEPAGDAHPAGRRHLAQLQREDSRARSCGSATSTWTSTTPTTSASAPSTGYERLLYDCMTRRRDAVPARRHGRSRLVRRAADPRRLEGAAAAQLPELRRRHLGTARGRGADGARRS